MRLLRHSREGVLLSGINNEERQESVVQTGEIGLATLRRLNCVIPREVAPSAPPPPPGVVREHVRFGGNLEAERDEWFIAGTEQREFAPDRAPQSAAPRILAPTDGTILALDPDIPPANQRLRLQAAGRPAAWSIDGRIIARGPHAQWPPWPGKHVVRLVDARGKTLDQVRIEVRGARVKR